MTPPCFAHCGSWKRSTFGCSVFRLWVSLFTMNVILSQLLMLSSWLRIFFVFVFCIFLHTVCRFLLCTRRRLLPNTARFVQSSTTRSCDFKLLVQTEKVPRHHFRFLRQIKYISGCGHAEVVKKIGQWKSTNELSHLFKNDHSFQCPDEAKRFEERSRACRGSTQLWIYFCAQQNTNESFLFLWMLICCLKESWMVQLPQMREHARVTLLLLVSSGTRATPGEVSPGVNASWAHWSMVKWMYSEIIKNESGEQKNMKQRML